MDDAAAERALAEFRHEAANPLALIVSAVRELDRRLPDDDEDARALLDVAARQVAVLERLLDRVRGTGDEAVDLDVSRFELGALVDETVSDLQLSRLDGRPVAVEGHEAHLDVEGDATLLRQALTNLLDNAAKYSPDDSVIHVVVGRDADHAEVWVQDEGEGIAPEDMQAVFKRFERRSDRPGGLGIGLAVVQRVVEAHGGTVEARPAPDGVGARFLVRLPVVDGVA